MKSVLMLLQAPLKIKLLMCNINKEKFRQIVAKRRDNTQILREINFGNSIGAKSAILTHLVALNLNIYECMHFKNTVIYQNLKPQKRQKLQFLNFYILQY